MNASLTEPVLIKRPQNVGFFFIWAWNPEGSIEWLMKVLSWCVAGARRISLPECVSVCVMRLREK